MKDNLEWLKEFTKEEIICWIEENSYFFSKIKKKDFLFARWQRKIKEQEVKESKELENLRNIDWKKRSTLSKQYNDSTDNKERNRIAREINVIDNQLHSHLERRELLDKERNKADLIYKQMSECKD